MLASNQPYQRVDDGIGAGFITGGLVGAGAMGAFHYGGTKASGALRNAGQGGLKLTDDIATQVKYAGRGNTPDADLKKLDKSTKFAERTGKVDDFVTKHHGKLAGAGWKGKAAAYGGSVLAGGILGGFVDGMNG